jgi:hypothetical protein
MHSPTHAFIPQISPQNSPSHTQNTPQHSILLDLTYLRADVAPCFPPSYNIMETFRTQYERHLVQNIGRLYNTQRGFPGMDQGELLQLMEWLDYYNQEVRVRVRACVRGSIQCGWTLPMDRFVCLSSLEWIDPHRWTTGPRDQTDTHNTTNPP